jgi:hypothetical protein
MTARGDPEWSIEDELVFKVVENLGNHDGEILALSGDLPIARAAFQKAVELYPDQAIDLRDRARVSR